MTLTSYFEEFDFIEADLEGVGIERVRMAVEVLPDLTFAEVRARLLTSLHHLTGE